MNWYNPDLLPQDADPEGSIRYENVTIIHEMIECHYAFTQFYDELQNANRLIIEEHNPEFNGYLVHEFTGTVLREANGDYSWWRNIKQKEIKV